MGSIYAHGVPEKAIENVTLTTHDWGHVSSWTNGDSSFVIQPGSGEIWVLRECRMKFSSGMTFSQDQSLLIEAGIPGYGSSIPITSYTGVRDFIKRADDFSVIDFMSEYGDLTYPLVEARLYFSEQVILWDSSGLDNGIPRTDSLGQIKLGSLTARIANNQPFTMAHDQSSPDIAICRYFLTIYEDPSV